LPIFLDRHDLSGLTASDIAEAHRKDLEVQDQYGVRFLTYWFDESRGTGFCLIDAPDIQTAMRVHDEAHGEVAKDVIEVDLSAVQAFLGRVSDPEPSGEANNVNIDSALRAIMFTDIVGSTSMTERLGDARSVEMVRAHDALVLRALKDKGGHVVKHTGDGIMASFAERPPPCNAPAPSSKRLKPSIWQVRRSFGCELVLTLENRSQTATTFLVQPFNWPLACVSWPSPMPFLYQVPFKIVSWIAYISETLVPAISKASSSLLTYTESSGANRRTADCE
jgi:hypothetical protein